MGLYRRLCVVRLQTLRQPPHQRMYIKGQSTIVTGLITKWRGDKANLHGRDMHIKFIYKWLNSQAIVIQTR